MGISYTLLREDSGPRRLVRDARPVGLAVYCPGSVSHDRIPSLGGVDAQRVDADGPGFVHPYEHKASAETGAAA